MRQVGEAHLPYSKPCGLQLTDPLAGIASDGMNHREPVELHHAIALIENRGLSRTVHKFRKSLGSSPYADVRSVRELAARAVVASEITDVDPTTLEDDDLDVTVLRIRGNQILTRVFNAIEFDFVILIVRVNVAVHNMCFTILFVYYPVCFTVYLSRERK